MKIAFAEPSLPKDGALVVTAVDGGVLSATAAQLDERLDRAVMRAMTASRYTGRAQQLLDLVAPAGLELDRIVIAGYGKTETLDARAAEELGGAIYGHLAKSGSETATIAVDRIPGHGLETAEIAARMALGMRLAAYRFDKYRTKEKPDDKPRLGRVTFMLEGASAAKKSFSPLDKLADGVLFARDLVSEPPNVLYPETLAKEAETLSKLGVEVEVLDQKAMRKMGMGALLGVAQGSEREPYLVVMQWKGAGGKQAPLAVVGKGVTFDTGGISIKPAAGMEDMKWDMGGSATVLGLMKAVAGRKAKANVLGVVALVENMPSGTAQRPGDVVTSASGQTIEVINTDAEGRLILCDALWYVQENFKPRAIVDLATLTGAIIVGLGHHHAGMFANDDALAEQLTAAGKAVGERVWRMPLDEDYDKQIKSDIADMKNVGGRDGGSITAAQFLKRFIGDVPWAHLDIAGVTWSTKDKPTVPKGGTGFGVRLLDRVISEFDERA